MLGVTLVLACCAVVALLLLYGWRQSYWRDRGVACPPGWPLLGHVANLLLLRRSPGQFLRDLYCAAPGEPLVGFYIFGRPAVLIRSPELLRSVLVKDFATFADRYNTSDEQSDPLGTRNLFVIKGPEWKFLRAKLSPTFTSGKMRAMFPLVVSCDQQMLHYLRSKLSAQGTVELDIKEVTARCTTDVINSCAFGISSNSVGNPDAEFRELGKKTFEYGIHRSLEVLVFFFTPYLSRLLRCVYLQKETNEFLRRVFWETLTAREKGTAAGAPLRNDLIDHLIQLKNQGSIQRDADDAADGPDDGDAALALPVSDADEDVLRRKFDFSGDDLLAQAAIFFVAGFETSSSTMTFCLYELALQPDLQARLRNEIRDHLQRAGGRFSYNMIHDMRYLDMVISETLRKYPTLPFLDRTCLRDYAVPGRPGCVIERGTPVYVSLLGLHTDPHYFPQPHVFDPERFSDKSTINPFTYMPFGNGPHNCIGMRFGLMSAKAGVAHVLSQFEVSVAADTPVPLPMATRGIVASTVGGVPLRFRSDPLVELALSV
ncbi:cytochrome P450 6k1-like [Schistocerca americana]|uniref:cytochrome P450 6k1-like n=1 Tax=Schistocerca americana TaxID=7009 RepID=UPI001F4FB8E2|nr:cytochrome P450 6k1-like [Schistocerca americana]